MEKIKKPSEREQIRTNVRIDENTYNKLLQIKDKTGYSINTIMKMSFDMFIGYFKRKEGWYGR